MRFLKTELAILFFVAGLQPFLASSQPDTTGNTLTAPANAWQQFRGSQSLSGVSDASLPEELSLLWTYEADEAIDSSAAIVDNSVYFGTYAGSLVALNLETGKERWAYTTGDLGVGESSPAVAGGLN